MTDPLVIGNPKNLRKPVTNQSLTIVMLRSRQLKDRKCIRLKSFRPVHDKLIHHQATEVTLEEDNFYLCILQQPISFSFSQLCSLKFMLIFIFHLLYENCLYVL